MLRVSHYPLKLGTWRQEVGCENGCQHQDRVSGVVSGVVFDTRRLVIEAWRRKVNGAEDLENVLEGKRMASGHTGNVVPRKGLRVRISCPPLNKFQ